MSTEKTPLQKFMAGDFADDIAFVPVVESTAAKALPDASFRPVSDVPRMQIVPVEIRDEPPAILFKATVNGETLMTWLDLELLGLMAARKDRRISDLIVAEMPFTTA